MTTAVNAATLLIGLLTGVVTARGLDPTDRGQFLAVVLWSGTIAAFSLVGLDQGITYGARGNVGHALDLTYALQRRVVLATSIGFVVAIVVNAFLMRTLSFGSIVVAVAGALPVLFNGITQMRLAPLLIAEKFTAWNLARLASPVLYVLLLSLLFASHTLTLNSAICAVAVGSFASMGVTLGAVRGYTPSPTWVSGDLRRIVAYGRQTLLITLPAFLAARVDQLFMGLLVPPATLGVYAVSASVASVLEVAKQTLDQLAFPHFARAGWQRRRLRLHTVAVTGVAVLISALLLAVAIPLIPFIYGDPYRGAVAPLPWLLMAVALRVGVAYMGAASRAGGQLRMLAKSQGIGLAATVAALLILLPWRGAQGAAEAVLAGQIINFITLFRGLDHAGLLPVIAKD
jgi:O-antigen/teichoic acid export membrane protein